MTTRQSPLDENDLEVINQALENADALAEDILRAKEAGIDVASDEERLAADRERLRRVKQSFFPGR